MITGQQIRQARMLLGLSREVVSESAGVGRSTLQRIEAGEQGVSIGKVNAVKVALEQAGAEFGDNGWIRVRSDG